jgi:hypothetical protein
VARSDGTVGWNPGADGDKVTGVALGSGKVAFKTPRGQFWNAERGGALKVTAGVIGSREEFRIVQTANGFAIAAANGRFLSASKGGQARLTSTSAGAGEAVEIAGLDASLASVEAAAVSVEVASRSCRISNVKGEFLCADAAWRSGEGEEFTVSLMSGGRTKFQPASGHVLAASADGRIISSAAESSNSAQFFRVQPLGDGFSMQGVNGKFHRGGAAQTSAKAEVIRIDGLDSLNALKPAGVLRVRCGAGFLGGSGWGSQAEGLAVVQVCGRTVFKAANGKFLALQPDGSLEATTDAIDGAKSFEVERVPGGFSFRGSNGCFLSSAGSKTTLESKTVGQAETLTLEGDTAEALEGSLEVIGAAAPAVAIKCAAGDGLKASADGSISWASRDGDKVRVVPLGAVVTSRSNRVVANSGARTGAAC